MAQRLSTLSVGDTVKFGSRWGKKTRFVITDKNHVGFPSNSVQLSNLLCDDTRPLDGREEASGILAVVEYGNNDVARSNLVQWMNSASKDWYNAQHAADHKPDAKHVGVDAYDAIPGMLNEYDPREIAMMQSVNRTIRRNNLHGGSTTRSYKAWLYDYAELGAYGHDNDVYSYGSLFAYFKDPSKRTFRMSEEGAKHSQAKTSRTDAITGSWTPSAGSARPYWSANCYLYDYDCNIAVYEEGQSYRNYAYTSYGVRFGVSIDGDVWVSDKDSDGDYRILLTSAPPVPTTITTDTSFRGGKDTTVVWTAVKDSTIQSIGYRLQVSYDGGAYQNLYEGIGTSWTGEVPFGTQTVQYRVCAVNNDDHIDSEYVVSGKFDVYNNHVPTITVTSQPAGTYVDSAPSMSYTVADEDADDTLTTKWRLDGNVVNTVTGRNGGTFTFSAEDWMQVLNGTHTMQLEVSDGKESATATATFTKQVTEAYFQNIIPVPATEAPTELICMVLGDIPDDVELYTVEACTNGYDANPTWEDIKDAVDNSSIYKFQNSAKTSDKWGVCVRVHIKRGKTEGYISSVLFNFLAGDSETSTHLDLNSGAKMSISYSENEAGGNTVTVG